MRIFQNVQLLGELLVVDRQLDGIDAGRGKQGDAPGAGRGAPALGSESDLRGDGMRGAQTNLRGWLAAQIPPNSIDAAFSMAGDRPGPEVFLFARFLARSSAALGALRVAIDGAHRLA